MSMRLVLAVLLVTAACDGASSQRPDGGGSDDASIDATECTDTGVVGCACAPVGPGGAGVIPVDRPLIKLVSDPVRCAIYGLASNAVLVFDTRLKKQIAKIDLAGTGTDLDIAGDGSRAVVGHINAYQLTLLDLEQHKIAGMVTTMGETARVEVTRDGVVFYVDVDQFNDVRRIVLASGVDTKLQEWVHYQADIELADDDVRLYVADSSLSSSGIAAYDTTDGVFGLVDSHTGSFSPPARQLLVSKQLRTYYAEHQWAVPNDLSFVTGGTGEPIYAEDDEGRLAVGKRYVWDAALVRKVGMHPTDITAAAFTAAGQELWTYSPSLSSIRYVATSEIVGAQTLGQRDVAAGSLASYTIDQLVHDPNRAALYARDKTRNVVIAIDPATLQPTREVRVGTEPSDVAIDPDGATLYVAHADTSAIARVSLAMFEFDRFVPTVKLPYEIEAVSPGRLVFNTEWGTTAPTLFDVSTRAAYPVSWVHNNAAIAVRGNTLFVGDTGSSGCHLSSYAISATALTRTGQTTYNNGYGFPSPLRIVVPTPSGATVFYAGHALDATNLSVIRYAVGQTIRSVSPDGRVALSSTHVFDVATGANLGALPFESLVQAIDPTSQTAYLLSSTGSLSKVNLSNYAP